VMDRATTPRTRVILVQDVFRQCIDARLYFNAVIKRCASKGWPDKKAAIETAFRIQEAFLKRLMVRLDYLAQHGEFSETEWSSYTSTALVHTRVQDDWTPLEEAALVRDDVAYAALKNELEELRKNADPAALEEPYQMARRDPELIAAGYELDRKVRELDERLSVSN
jgi:hypothetical protein